MTLLVDTDIHCAYDHDRMLDFLPEPWRTRYASGNRAPGQLRYWNPNGVMRADAVTPEGDRIEANPEALSRYFLDVNAIDYGLLNPASSLQLGLSRAGLRRRRRLGHQRCHHRGLAPDRRALPRLDHRLAG